MPKITVADFIMQHLGSIGVKHIFLLPGGGAMHLNDALAREKRIRPIICHHEQSVGIAAEANGRTNEIGFGVAMVTSGPGSTNIITPVAGAWLESIPMLILSGQAKSTDLVGSRKIRQGGVQEIPIIPIIQSITKYAALIKKPEDIKIHLKKAIEVMLSGRPGPVWLDIPLDVQAATIDSVLLADATPPNKLNQFEQNYNHSFIDQLLSNSNRPLILAGHGVRIANAQSEFLKAVNNLQIPCVFTWNAADLMDWDSPMYIGRPGVVAARAPNFAIQNCDLLIIIGSRIDNILTAYNPNNFARQAKKILVDIDEEEINNQKVKIDYPLQMDAKKFITNYLSKIIPPKNDKWLFWQTKCLDWKNRYPTNENHTPAPNNEIGHYYLVDSFSRVLPPDCIIATGSSGLAIEVFYSAFKNKAGQRFYLTSGLGSMGYGLPSAIGACLGSGRNRTFCIESDGSFMLNLQELATLKELNLPITIFILNNNGYASIRNTQKNYFMGRYLGTDLNSGLYIPNFTEIGDALGIPSFRIDSKLNLDEKLLEIIVSNNNALSICEIILHPNETLYPKSIAVPNPDGTMNSMPLEDMSPLLSITQLESEMIIPLLSDSYKARNLG
jgi:acetolactate synthase-1/2/3 large subunit